LESGWKFTDWLKVRIEEYGFEKNKDFEIRQKNSCSSGQEFLTAKSQVYLTLNRAKELAMVEKTWVGRRVRKYFLECERQLLSSKPTGKMITDEYGTKYKPKVLPEAKKIKVVASAAEILGIETGDSLASELNREQLLTCMIELLDANVGGKKVTRKKLIKLIENPELSSKDVGLISEYTCFF
jgi:phage anti-repressor protein